MNIKLLLLILFIAAGIFAVTKIVNKSDETKEIAFSPQTNSEGNVEVEITPKVSKDKKSWSFKIILTTHSGSLDEDLAKQTFLESNSGEKIEPLKWEGSPPGGHHREGELIFPSFSQTPKSVKLILQSIGQISERSFVWNTK